MAMLLPAHRACRGLSPPTPMRPRKTNGGSGRGAGVMMGWWPGGTPHTHILWAWGLRSELKDIWGPVGQLAV